MEAVTDIGLVCVYVVSFCRLRTAQSDADCNDVLIRPRPQPEGDLAAAQGPRAIAADCDWALRRHRRLRPEYRAPAALRVAGSTYWHKVRHARSARDGCRARRSRRDRAPKSHRH